MNGAFYKYSGAGYLKNKCLISLEKVTMREVLDHMVWVYLTLKETAKSISRVAVSFWITPAIWEWPSCYELSPVFGMVRISKIIYSNRQVIISFHGFNYIFLWANDVENFFFVCHLYILFSKRFVHIFIPFSNFYFYFLIFTFL